MDKEELIQKYLHGQLSESESNRLSEMLDADPDLKEDLEIESVFYAHRNKALKQMLKEKHFQGIKSKKRFALRAAAIILLLALPAFTESI